MLSASVGDIPDWIQALGVVIALGVSAYQLRRQAADAKESARRHEQTERDAAARHRQEMADRRRERLLTYYPRLAQGIEEYLSNMAIGEQLSADAEELARAATDRRDSNLKEGALTMQKAAMSHRAMGREAMARASTAHLAVRFDEIPDYLKRVDDLMTRVRSWRSGPTVDIAAAAFELVQERGDALRPKNR
jgi:hypothetical protein